MQQRRSSSRVLAHGLEIRVVLVVCFAMSCGDDASSHDETATVGNAVVCPPIPAVSQTRNGGSSAAGYGDNTATAGVGTGGAGGDTASIAAARAGAGDEGRADAGVVGGRGGSGGAGGRAGAGDVAGKAGAGDSAMAANSGAGGTVKGGTGGQAGTGGAGGKGGVGGVGGRGGFGRSADPAWVEDCERCELDRNNLEPITEDGPGCWFQNGLNLLNNCRSLPGLAERGPRVGTERGILCTDLLSCVRRTGCAVSADGLSVDFSRCLCGPGNSSDCMAVGACAADFMAAAEEDTDPRRANINSALPENAAGAVRGLLEVCDTAFCPVVCRVCIPSAVNQCEVLSYAGSGGAGGGSGGGAAGSGGGSAASGSGAGGGGSGGSGGGAAGGGGRAAGSGGNAAGTGGRAG